MYVCDFEKECYKAGSHAHRWESCSNQSAVSPILPMCLCPLALCTHLHRVTGLGLGSQRFGQSRVALRKQQMLVNFCTWGAANKCNQGQQYRYGRRRWLPRLSRPHVMPQIDVHSPHVRHRRSEQDKASFHSVLESPSTEAAQRAAPSWSCHAVPQHTGILPSTQNDCTARERGTSASAQGVPRDYRGVQEVNPNRHMFSRSFSVSTRYPWTAVSSCAAGSEDRRRPTTRSIQKCCGRYYRSPRWRTGRYDLTSIRQFHDGMLARICVDDGSFSGWFGVTRCDK